MQRSACCSFTGHRPEKLPWGSKEDDPRCLALKGKIQKELDTAYHRGYRHFISGMARGTDLYFCEAALALRERYHAVTVEAAVPFAGQAERWSATEQQRYHALLDRCDFETVIQHHYSPGCLQRRNRYLVDHASLLIAAYNGKGGGTLYTLSYAIEQELELIILDL